MSNARPSAELGYRKPPRLGAHLNVDRRKKIGHKPQHICITANRSSAFMQTPLLAGMCEIAHMDVHREAVRAYLVQVVKVTGLELSKLARKAKVSPSTLTRFMNNDEFKPTISLKTLSKVSAASGVPVPPNVTQAPIVSGSSLKKSDKLSQLEHQQLSLLNRSWDALYDDERAAIVATARAFISNRPKQA